MATEPGSALPIHPKTISNLNDKLYEKRKLGALEVEVLKNARVTVSLTSLQEIVKQLQASKDQAGVNNVIAYMVSTFANSSNPNSRKGGLIGLVAIAIGLGGDVFTYLPLICPPVLRCFTDQDSRVRYYACESLYNVAKISRGRILPFFNEIFDGLCKLAADPDLNVKNGAQLLDRLMKDIVIESNVFEVEKFIPLLRDRVHVVNPFVRQFLIGWLNLLDSVPDIDLVAHLPSFLGGLFNMLADPKKEIKREAETTLGEFLKQLRRSPRVNVAEIVKILLPYCSSTDEGTRLAALNWVNEFLTPPSGASLSVSASSLPSATTIPVAPIPSPAPNAGPALSTLQSATGGAASVSPAPASLLTSPFPIPTTASSSSSALPSAAVALSPPPVLTPPVALPAPASSAPTPTPAGAITPDGVEKDRREELLPFGPELLSAILLAVSHEAADIQFVASKANAAFLELLKDTQREIALGAFLQAVVVQFLNGHVATRLAALEWTRQLHAKASDKFAAHAQELFPALLKLLSDPAEEVVRQDLAVMGLISTNPAYFDRLMQSLISLFATDPTLLEKRGTMIVRQLSLHLDAQRVFRRLSVILEESTDEDFATAMVQTLNIILLTSAEFLPLRASLKALHASAENKELFVALYRSWSHNPSATLALCLLAQQYTFAYKLIQTFAELEVTVNFLIEIDKLVQLLESPIFTSLRLQLLEPEQHADLFKALYGVLMLLPQSAAYETLKSRLNAISSLGVLHLLQKSSTDKSTNVIAPLEAELLAHFLDVQRKHAKRRKELPARAQLVVGPTSNQR